MGALPQTPKTMGLCPKPQQGVTPCTRFAQERFSPLRETNTKCITRRDVGSAFLSQNPIGTLHHAQDSMLGSAFLSQNPISTLLRKAAYGVACYLRRADPNPLKMLLHDYKDLGDSGPKAPARGILPLDPDLQERFSPLRETKRFCTRQTHGYAFAQPGSKGVTPLAGELGAEPPRSCGSLRAAPSRFSKKFSKKT